MYQLFPGKVILFGEYSIIAGSKALVMPLPQYWGKLQIPETQDEAGDHILSGSAAKESNQELRGFYEYLIRQQEGAGPAQKLDSDRLKLDLDKGLYFQSSIPVRYGAGSSAALVAAIYDAYSDGIIQKFGNTDELLALRDILGILESCFHGISSGIDPLCSFTGKALYNLKDKILPVSIPKIRKDAKLFLLDSGIQAETNTLVSDFKTRMEKEEDFASAVNDELAVLVESGIDGILGIKDWKQDEKQDEKQNDLKAVFRKISEWQLKHFTPMIHESILPVWEHGIKSSDYSLKLCGSGGGGFFLGYTEQWTKISDSLKQTERKIIPLDL